MTNAVKLTTLEDLMADVQKAADIIEVPVADVTWDIMRAYETGFTEDTVGFRITSKKEQELNVRYQSLTPQDPYAVAVEHGFLTPTDHPVYDLIPQVRGIRPEAGYFIDIGVTHGFEKIWGFFTNPITIEELCALDAIPASVPAHMDYFKKYGLNWLGIVNANYVARTTNLYWMGGSYDISPEIAAQIVVDAGLPRPSDADNEFNARAMVLYMTFSWDSDRVERLCYCHEGPVDQVPKDWPPLIQKFAAEVPLRASERRCTFCTTYGHGHPDYVKFEGDYHSTIKVVLGPVFEGSNQARAAAES